MLYLDSNCIKSYESLIKTSPFGGSFFASKREREAILTDIVDRWMNALYPALGTPHLVFQIHLFKSIFISGIQSNNVGLPLHSLDMQYWNAY